MTSVERFGMIAHSIDGDNCLPSCRGEYTEKIQKNAIIPKRQRLNGHVQKTNE